MTPEQKLILIGLAQMLIGIIKSTSTRWIVRTLFTGGELPAAKWYTVEFISALNASRVGGLLLIASFTILTFPLGMWKGSFNIGFSYSFGRLYLSALSLIMFPVQIYIMKYQLNEFVLNKTTITGIVGHMVAYLLMILSAWFMYQGNLEATP